MEHKREIGGEYKFTDREGRLVRSTKVGFNVGIVYGFMDSEDSPEDIAEEYSISEKSKDYSRFTFLFPLKEKNPLVQEGDLRELYSSKTKTLPELLNERSFSVSEDTFAEILVGDLEFIQGMHVVFGTEAAMRPKRLLERKKASSYDIDFEKYFIHKPPKKLSPFANTYLIVDVGHAHLIGVAWNLIQNGIDCSFVIGESTHPRFREAIKYWAGQYQTVKEAQNDFVGYATMLDTHRREKFSEEMFPTPEKLAELGIKKVVCLSEWEASPEPENFLDNHDDVRPVIEKYKASGLEIIAYGIDNRNND